MILSTVTKLYPTRLQESILDSWLSTATEVYNFYVDRMVEKATTGDKKNYGAYTWKKILTQEKRSEWNSVNRSVLNNTIFAIESGIQSTLTKRAKAKYFKSEKKKKKYENAKFPHKRDKNLTWVTLDNGYEILDNHLLIKKTGKGIKKDSILCSIQIRGNRDIPESIPCSQIIISKKNNDWYLILYYKVNDSQFVVSQPKDIIGLDWGLNTPFVSDQNKKFEIPEFRHEREIEHYKSLQRKLQHQKKGSKNSEKTKLRMRKIKDREVRCKKDFYFKLALFFVTTYKIICIEDLDLNIIKNKKNRHGRSMDKQSSSIFFSILSWMAYKYGSTLVKVNPYHTSKTCSDCGFTKTDLKIYNREWTCPNCGSIHSRDHNAAINIRNLGLYTLRIRGSAREVKDRLPSIQDCFQATGIKREEIQTHDVERY